MKKRFVGEALTVSLLATLQYLLDFFRNTNLATMDPRCCRFVETSAIWFRRTDTNRGNPWRRAASRGVITRGRR